MIVKAPFNFAIIDISLSKNKAVLLKSWPVAKRADVGDTHLYYIYGVVPQKMVGVQLYVPRNAPSDLLKFEYPASKARVPLRGTNKEELSEDVAKVLVMQNKGYIKTRRKDGKYGQPVVQLFVHPEETTDGLKQVVSGGTLAYVVTNRKYGLGKLPKTILRHIRILAVDADIMTTPLYSFLVHIAMTPEEIANELGSEFNVKTKVLPPAPFQVLMTAK